MSWQRVKQSRVMINSSHNGNPYTMPIVMSRGWYVFKVSYSSTRRRRRSSRCLWLTQMKFYPWFFRAFWFKLECVYFCVSHRHTPWSTHFLLLQWCSLITVRLFEYISHYQLLCYNTQVYLQCSSSLLIHYTLLHTFASTHQY